MLAGFLGGKRAQQLAVAKDNAFGHCAKSPTRPPMQTANAIEFDYEPSSFAAHGDQSI